MRLMGNAGCVRPMQEFLQSLTQVCKERFHQQSFLEASDLLLGDSRASTPNNALQAHPLGRATPAHLTAGCFTHSTIFCFKIMSGRRVRVRTCVVAPQLARFPRSKTQLNLLLQAGCSRSETLGIIKVSAHPYLFLLPLRPDFCKIK